MYETLRRLREAARVEQGELADEAGLPQSYLCALERGRRPLTTQRYHQLIAHIYHIRQRHDDEFRAVEIETRASA